MRRRVHSEVLLERRDVRAKALDRMRSFRPIETPKFIAINPVQPNMNGRSWGKHVDDTNDMSVSSEDAGAGTAAPYVQSVSYHSAPNARRSRSAGDAMNSSQISLPSPESLSLPLPDGIPQVGASVPNDNPDFLMLQHQEALYRKLLLPEVDTWFTSLVEAAWDERDQLIVTAEEKVQRYWLQSDEHKARETIAVFKRNEEVQMERIHSHSALWLEQLVERSHVNQEYFASLAELTSLRNEEYQIAVCRSEESVRDALRRASDAEQKEGLPPIAVRTPTKPRSEQRVMATSLPSPQVMDSHMAGFLFGYAELFDFVLEAEQSRRSMIVDAESAQRHNFQANFERYMSRTASLRRPYGSKAITLEEAEMAERRIEYGRYFDMLFDACNAMELLHRRQLELVDEPTVRKVISSREREEWIHARRAECDRRLVEENIEEEAVREARLAALHAEQKFSQQRVLFERAECDARFEIIRRESRMFHVIEEDSMDDRVLAQLFQSRYVMRLQSITWTPEQYQDIVLGETSQRIQTMREEQEAFQSIKSKEVSSYIHTHRNMMINREVAGQLKSFA